jgi:hypothetical protein
MLARGGFFIWTMLVAWTGSQVVCAAPAAWVHEASGLRFPDSIEGKWQRKQQTSSGKTAAVEYQSRAGWRVSILVKPAPGDAHGPTKQDGGPSSDASASFRKELDAQVRALGEGFKATAVVSSMRFRIAPQQSGPIGTKVVVTGQLNNVATCREVLLAERNGCFVTFTVEYPQQQSSGAGLAYTDVAHFVTWPSSTKATSSSPRP